MDFILALLQVILIDLVLAADNAIVIGVAASGLPARQREKAIRAGLLMAFAMRVGFALITVQLLQIVGLLLAGGLLLLWVGWKMLRDLRIICPPGGKVAAKSMRSSIMQILFADISMSLDNTLAVAGAARESTLVLVIGLSFSIVLMGTVASYLAIEIERRRWIAYVGIAAVLWVAAGMIWEGSMEVLR